MHQLLYLCKIGLPCLLKMRKNLMLKMTSTQSGVYFVYIVQCRFGTFYTGWTNDLQKRITAHNEGRGAKYLKGRGPVVLKYQQKFPTANEAMSAEYAIKKLTRQEKEELIKGSYA